MSELSKASDLIAEFLKAKEIKLAFGVIGSANAYIFDSIHTLGYTEIITTHHEQSAVMAAGAVFRASGRLSVALVTAGAGASNAVTGVISNWADSIPCLVLAGQEGTHHLEIDAERRMFGTQGYDAAKMMLDVTKLSRCVLDPCSLQDALEDAYEMSLTPRYGPVWLDIPFDVQAARVQPREWRALADNKPMPVLSEVRQIIAAIRESKRPVILGGHGVRLAGAQANFKEFTSNLNVPVSLSWSAIDLLASSDENFVGRWGLYGQRAANFIVQSADLVLVFGSRLAIPQVGYDFNQFARGAKVIVVDIESCKHPVHLQVFGDCKLVLETLEHMDMTQWMDSDGWWSHCSAMKQLYPLVSEEHEDEGGYVNSYKFIGELSKRLDDDHVVVTDMGTALLSGHQSIHLKAGQTMFTSLGLGEMGYGLPGAIGAAFACPSRNVLCLNNDGGIMMNLQELHTIVEHKLKVKVVIFNNDGYLMIKHTQKMLFKGNYVQVDKKTGVGLPDFSKLMPAFGYEYFKLHSWETDTDIIAEFLAHPSASALEVFMHPEQAFIPKVKGVALEDGKIAPAPLEDMSPLLGIRALEEGMLVPLSDTSKAAKR